MKALRFSPVAAGAAYAARRTVGQRAIRERFRDVHAANLVGAMEVGKRSRHAQHAVITARREPHGIGGLAQQ
jgi:hypothetical protein